jgi:hypothetical protein
MGSDKTKELNALEKTIISGKYLNDINSIEEFGGADVIIACKMDEKIRHWLGDQPIVISFQNTPPQRCVVITQYSRELSWLFYQLRDIFRGDIDYISKYDFFRLLAQSANEHIATHKDNMKCEELLLSVIKSARGFKMVNYPDDIKLPFFAYGLFKPGQLAYFRIKELVSEVPVEANVHGSLKERDGIPLLSVPGDRIIYGMLIKFKCDKELEAYKNIADLEPFDVYRWEVVQLLDRIKANTLVGIKIDRGTIDFEASQWDGKNDPYFKDALEEIATILKENSESNGDFKQLFRLQMAYGLLWTVIERYAGLKYNLSSKDVTKKVMQIAKEPAFVIGLQNHVKKENTNRRVVNASDPRKTFTLDPNNPEKAINYYYQVRSNSVHRGKAVHRDFGIIQTSLKELLAIFKDVLKEAWKE